MLVAIAILSFVLGAVATLAIQFWFTRRWLNYQPSRFPPYKQQHHKMQLPPALAQTISGLSQRSSISRDSTSKPDSTGKVPPSLIKGEPVGKVNAPRADLSGKIPPNVSKDHCLILNVLSHFLFAELKDTARVRRWMSRKLNVEFDEMLSSNTGKLMNQIQVRDFSFGESFPIVEALELKDVELSKDKEGIERVDVALEIDYAGGFQLTLDVDVIFGAWAYLFVKVTKLAGVARLQLSRIPFTHWSFSFYEEPLMEFEVDSRFNGRPIPQISSLIVNQIKRMIRKKHILPSYKMRFKPLFLKPEEAYVNPDLRVLGNKLGRGQLTVKVLHCTRLQEMARDSKLYCTVSVDKEDLEELWRKSWEILHITMKVCPNIQLGLAIKEQLSGEKTEKKRVVIDTVTQETPAAEAGLRKGDIIEYINNVRVLSFKHASKQMKTAIDTIDLTVRRHKVNFSLEHSQSFQEPEQLLDVEEQESDTEFVTITVREPSKPTDTTNGTTVNTTMSQTPPKSTMSSSSIKPSAAPESQKNFSAKMSEKMSQKFQTGKRKILNIGNNSPGDASGDKSVERTGNEGPGVQNGVRSEEEGAQEGVTGSVSRSLSAVAERSQSATSSPLKTLRDDKRQRALSDTSLHRASDSEGSMISDLGSYGYQTQQRRAGEVTTRELDFSTDPEWNEEFEFVCREEDQFVNICIWCKLLQTDRGSKQGPADRGTRQGAPGATGRADTGAKNTPPQNDELPYYNITTKIGYVSIPLSDISAGCLLTLQGDTQYTVYLQPPEETITATRAKVPYSSHPGFDKTICHGDITLSFHHAPFKQLESSERKVVIEEILNPKSGTKHRPQSLPRQPTNGQHNFQICHFQSATYCDFCGKKIWLKGGMHCMACSMVCHKKCVEKCHLQTKCHKEGPRNAFKPDEPWLPPVKSRPMGAGDQASTDDRDMKAGQGTGGTGGKFWKNFRNKDTQPSLPLNIPSRSGVPGGKVSPSPSPSRSPSPFTSLLHHPDPLRKMGSNKSLSMLDKDDDSDEEPMPRYRQSTYSLNDNIVIEAKEKGKELYSELSLPERKKTLDEMVTKLQDTIDKESEYKSELLRSCNDSSDPDQKRMLSQQLDKCEEKMDALMMMMVHYCAGLQHCLDQEEAHKRLKDLDQASISVTEEPGIQFVVTDTQDST